MPRLVAPRSADSPQSASKRVGPSTPSRQSKRVRGARKSYAETPSDSDADRSNAERGDEGSDFDVGNLTDDDTESGSNDSSNSGEEAGVTATSVRGQSSTPEKANARRRGAELWKPGAKLELGTQVIIKRPKAREEGDTPYTDNTIHPNTMLFLKDLKAHNDRSWLKAHDADYRASLQDFNSFLECLSNRVMEADETIPELPVKDVIFRIYRDVRFSKDQTPYKTHFSAAWSRTGRKGPYAAYYVQIQPNGGSFIGGGLWQPEAQALARLRSNIDRKPHEIKQVLIGAGMRRTFFRNIPNDEKKAIKAFVNQPSNVSNALKNHPKGYDANHVDIELLRLRNFTIGTKLSDEDIISPQGLDRIAEVVGCMVPFITYLNSVVMPEDDDLSSSASSTPDNETEASTSDDDRVDEGVNTA